MFVSFIRKPGYLFSSLGLGNFQPKFRQIHFILPFLFLFLLGPLLSIGFHTLYYPIGLSICCSDWVISIILSSRSALLYMLFIALSSTFILANKFSNFLFFFMVSNSLLHLSAFLSTAHFSNFIVPFLSWVSITLKRSVSLFFHRNSLGLLFGSCFICFIILLAFSYPMSLDFLTL